MCGIVAVINRDSNSESIGEEFLAGLQRAMAVQKHRGPDEDGVCAFTAAGSTAESENALSLTEQAPYDGVIGFNRLSIKDLSSAGHQPMLSPDKKVILAFNGEIYNDNALRQELTGKGYKFRGSSDTEVILNMYLEYGFDSMVKKLNGMFAIVIMDLRTNTLFTARDRFGIKPLYYSIQDGRIFLASELKCMIQFKSFRRELDLEAFNARIIFSRPSDYVLLKGVFMLPPGSAMSLDSQGSVRTWKFFDIDSYARDDSRHYTMSSVMEEFDAVLRRALAGQMISDVKVGCQVSGGIDSSLVSYYAVNGDRARLDSGVSIVDEAGTHGEEYYISHVGEMLGLPLHKFMPSVDDFADNYEKLIWHNDAPVYQPFFSQFYQLAKGAKKYVTVLLSGEGADEIAGGYSRFPAGIYQPFLSGLGLRDSGIKSYGSYAEYAVMTDSTVTGFTAKRLDNTRELIDTEIEYFNQFHGSNFMKHLKYETSRRLPESLMRQDKMTMANSIENRVPLLDNQVVDFIMRIPEDMLIRFTDVSPLNLSDNPLSWAQGKYLLKEMCAKIFGRSFAYRKKAIMVFDNRKILASERFRELFYDSVFPSMKARDIVDAETIKALYDNIYHISMKQIKAMWRVIALETWCRLFLD